MDTEPSPSEDELQKMYLESLSSMEKDALEIAKSHLGMTYQTDKSNGYLKWKKENNY
jgi:hypothetical protein